MSSRSVLVTGASGYIGQQVAIAYRDAGYRVYGLVRSKEKGETLARNEVFPVVGELNDTHAWEHLLPNVSIVVDTVMDFTQQDTYAPNRKLLNLTAAAAKVGRVEKTYIYTSGILVNPHAERHVVRDESIPLSSEGLPPLIAGRVEFEQEVIQHTGVRGIVIRPGFVYGGRVTTGHAGNFLMKFFENNETKDKIVLNNEIRHRAWSWVHVADLATAFVSAGRLSHQVKGEVFNIVGNTAPSYEELTRAGATVAGFKGTYEYTDEKGTDLLFAIANKSVVVSNTKAADLLNWHPVHLGPLEEIDVYYHTFKAHTS